MQTLLSILILIAFIYGITKLYRFSFQTSKKNNDDLYFSNVCDGVHKLSILVDRLEQLEEIITDIQSSSTKNLKGVRIIVPSTLGKNNEHQMLINGNDFTSKQLLSITYAERKKLRTSLQNSIEELYRYGITETITETNTENDDKSAGEGE